MPHRYTDASHNLLFTLPKDKWLEDLAVSAEGDVTGYQEAGGPEARAVLKDHCAAADRVLFQPKKCGTPISFKKDVFSYVRIDRRPVRGVIEAHLGAMAMGVEVQFNPPRDFSYVGLLHKTSGKKLLRINVHPVAGALRPEGHPEHDDSAEVSAWKDWAIGQYWLDVVAFTASQMSLQDPGRQTTSSLWDIVTLGGDYNGELDNYGRWYYPAPLLDALYERDKHLNGLDHLQHGHGSDVRVERRWAEAVHSDHGIHFVERSIVPVADFPRQ